MRSPSTEYNADVGLGGSNSGGAQTTRVGELRTQVSVQVVALEPDGSLRIEGVQALTVNGENQRIRLKGLVRPQDVSAQNTVWSNRIANAELELDGVGIVSESQRQRDLPILQVAEVDVRTTIAVLLLAVLCSPVLPRPGQSASAALPGLRACPRTS